MSMPQNGAQQTPSGQNVTDTANGFLVGVDPATPPQGGILSESAVVQSQQDGLFVPAQDNTVVQQPGVGAPAQPTPVPQTVESLPQLGQPGGEPQYFTAEDVARIRAEEKEKLYGRIQQTEEQLAEIRRAQEEREAAEQAERDRIAAEAKAQEEQAMEVRELLERREQEWNQRFEQLEQERARQEALFQRERELQELDRYRQQMIEQNSEYIMPELRDLIGGATVEEIDRSVNEMRERTSAIMQNIADAAQQVQRPTMRGVTPTGAPPVGPMEQASTYENLTAEQISNMSMDEYRQHRDRLLQAASPTFRG